MVELFHAHLFELGRHDREVSLDDPKCGHLLSASTTTSKVTPPTRSKIISECTDLLLSGSVTVVVTGD
jgi:hypothetical protein